MGKVKPVNETFGLLPGDGMSASKSTVQQRGDVLDKLQDEPSEDCITYGFFMGAHYPGPIPDYNGTDVKREINIKHLKQ